MGDILKLIDFCFISFCLIGGLIFGIIYLIIFSNTKIGKQFRKDLFNLVERGRRNE